MRRILVPLLAAVVLAACSERTPVGSDVDSGALRPRFAVGSAPEQVMPGEIIVKPKEGADVAAIAREHGVQVAGRGYQNAFVLMRGAVGNERALAARIGQDSRVVYAEPNFLRQPTADPDPRLWAFHNDGTLSMSFTSGANRGQTVTSLLPVNDADEDAAGADVGAGFGAGGTDVVIGSIDTGVDFSHTEFTGGRLIAGHDWYSDDADPSDEDGHGTHTTGTMAGATVGVAGVTGAAPHVKVFVQRVCGRRGCPTSAIVSAIRAAADAGVVAMNLSLGGSSESQAEKDAIAYATGKNALVIASAGNGSTGTVECPACDPNAISVAATDWMDEHAYYTSWGDGLDISAPGGELYSNTTEEGGIYSSYLGGGYAYLQGTSMAAPQVTGTAAVAASVTGDRGAALRARIEGSADDLGAPGYDTDFGNGRLNTFRAVTGQSGNTGGGDTGGGTTLDASFTDNCDGLACTFTANATGLTYDWNFGDPASSSQNTATGSPATHTFSGAGDYTVTLQVGDGTSTATSSQTVSCRSRGKNGVSCH